MTSFGLGFLSVPTAEHFLVCGDACNGVPSALERHDGEAGKEPGEKA